MQKLGGEKNFSKISHQEYLKIKEQARELVLKRIDHFNQAYGYRYNKVFIRNQKTRWGSCSLDGNLNFNFKLALIPKEQADYVIVHELCHLDEFNHSQKFWNLVAKTIPEYKRIKKQLKSL
jgi:predicted metal-dependent hydrolase